MEWVGRWLQCSKLNSSPTCSLPLLCPRPLFVLYFLLTLDIPYSSDVAWCRIAGMHFATALSVLAVAALVAARSPRHVGKKLPDLRSRASPMARALYEPDVAKRAASPFATAKTKSTAVHAEQPASGLTCYRICRQWHSASTGRLRHWYVTC